MAGVVFLALREKLAAQFEFYDLPSVVKFIAVVLSGKESEMSIPVERPFAALAHCVASLLETVIVPGSLFPLGVR